MMIQTDIKFSKNVLLMDIALLGNEVAHVRATLSERLNRKLPLVDLPKWLVCLALDGEVLRFGGDVQVILVCSRVNEQLPEVVQSDFLQRDGMAFFVPSVGEFSISCVHPAGFTDTCHLFLDLVHILLDSSDVVNLMLLPSEKVYDTKVQEELDKLVQEKGAGTASKACLYRIFSQQTDAIYRQPRITPSLAHVLGMQPE